MSTKVKEVKQSEINLLIDADLKSQLVSDASEQTAFESFKAVVFKAHDDGIFKTDASLDVLKGRIKLVFQEANNIGYEKRITILTNVKLAVVGGVKDKKTYPGRVKWEIIKALLDNHKAGGIKAFLPLIAAEVPETLKRAKRVSSGSNASASSSKEVSSVKDVGSKEVNKPLTRKDAIQLAVMHLQIVERFLKPGSDAALIHEVADWILTLNLELAVPMPESVPDENISDAEVIKQVVNG